MSSTNERNSIQPSDMGRDIQAGAPKPVDADEACIDDRGLPARPAASDTNDQAKQSSTPEKATRVSSKLPDGVSAITRWADLAYNGSVSVQDEKGDLVYSHCEFFHTDADYAAYYYKSKLIREEVTLEMVKKNLARIPDHVIYPEMSAITTRFKRPAIGPGEWLKVPAFNKYDDDSFGVESFGAKLCLGEALVYEILARSPHPNIAKYHGCFIRRGRIIGIVLDKYSSSLLNKLSQAEHAKELDIDADSYMKAIVSGVQHLHSLGLAHNDLNPMNIMLDDSGNPVIIDLGSCRPFGNELMTAGSPGWCDENDETPCISAARHDDYSLAKIEAWLKEQVSLVGKT